MVKIVGDIVKNAVVSKLLQIEKNTSVYKESITVPQFPHFFVYQVSLSNQEERKGKFFLDYLMNVRYRIASDPSTDLKLESKLDAMAVKLLEEFDIIPMGETFIRCTDKTCEKVEGILQFNFNVRILVQKIDDREHILQNSLKINIKEVFTNG